ncbi:hypothetical protein HMPREF9999_00531 [Alloprevotella sp. oral taxon 473 str. F0040]|nr:hypothetical protein HMPREF9999_00531 [Alloprevotella sp. oral taxon 473 str. F0040]
MRRKREKIEEKCRFFLKVCLFCKVDMSELRESGRIVQVKHKLLSGANVDGEWEDGGNKIVGDWETAEGE